MATGKLYRISYTFFKIILRLRVGTYYSVYPTKSKNQMCIKK